MKTIDVEFEVNSRFLHNFKNRLEHAGTIDEVVLVVPCCGGKILLHTKAFYPEGSYRLPTGRMHRGETPDAAFAREFHEELGQEGHIDRKPGVIRTTLKSGNISVVILSHVYLSREISKEPRPDDLEEQITGFERIPASELRLIAENLRNLPPHWRDWGHFRATAHDFAAENLIKH